MPTPAISVIVPVYNRRKLIDEALRSLRAQTFSDWECIVVDDRSVDGTPEMVQSHIQEDPRIRLVSKPETLPRGPSASRNIGLESATGRYIHFFDSDDLLEPDFYSTAMARMETGELDYFVVGVRWFIDGANPDASGELDKVSDPFVSDDFLARGFVGKHPLWAQNIIWRHGLLEESGKLIEELTMMEDLEYTIRSACLAKRFGFDNRHLVKIRRHLDSLTYETSIERDLVRRRDYFDAFGLILGHLERVGQCTPEAVEHALQAQYTQFTWLVRQGGVQLSSLGRNAVLLRNLFAHRRWRLFRRLLFLSPFFWAKGLGRRLAR